MRLGRVAIRLIAVLGMLAIMINPAIAPGVAAAPAPEIKVTPQAGSNEVLFLVTGVGFLAPAVTGPLYLQVVYQATNEYVPFGATPDEWAAEAFIEATDEGLLATVITFGAALPDGAYQARIGSAPIGGTIYDTYDARLDSTLPVRPAISVTPNAGPPGDPEANGTLFILAGTSLAPNTTYTLEVVKADGTSRVNFTDPTVVSDADGIVIQTLTFGETRPSGEYIARLLLGTAAVAETTFTITARVVPPVTQKPEIKVTPQAGSSEVLFLVTGVGFGPPQVNGPIYLQVLYRATEQYLEFDDASLEATEAGLIATVLTFGSDLPDGAYLARVASAPTGGTVYASYEMRLDSTLPSRPAISVTPSFGPPGDSTAGGTLFILAGNGLTPGAVYTLEVVKADGTSTVNFPDPNFEADADGIILVTLEFAASRPLGEYIARLKNAGGAVVAEARFGIGTAAPSASPTPAPSASPSGSPRPSPIPSPPPTGNGGFLPGLPNTGSGGAASADTGPNPGLAVGGLVIITLVTIGSALRRRHAA
jgi:hypothetical protein